ncbi:IS1182 family transposase [Haloplasma contractile]|uniref:Transposase IS4 family protein n=1 Tax=Haloplasma contractile SSD-17B TaxID=1033810 RepID=U2DUH0_9MOLU|nr:IS1182 family transposase [Haloplasma contractile]ERJ12047.1 transposase IS4 family protein [Haloplasma contractile SSD-17B]
MIKENKLVLSPFIEIYDYVVKENHLLKKINKICDFDFIYDELVDKYCLDNGRKGENPIYFFKLLLLKKIYKLSDEKLVERAFSDMAFKYFLGIAPEDKIVYSSALTKFRRLRLQDNTLLDTLINKSMSIAIEQGVITSKRLIMDATHTKSRYNQITPYQALVNESKELRKSVYEVNESAKSSFPRKTNDGILEHQIQYCKDLIAVIKESEKLMFYPDIQDKLSYLEEVVDDNIDQLKLSTDEDAKVGHKTYDTSFYGYKTHIAINDERIVTAAVVTSGEKHDGKYLEELVKKSIDNGMEVEEILGDSAYSIKDNIEYTNENKIKLISKLSKTVTHGNKRKVAGFEFNKDADMYTCPERHLSIEKIESRPKKKVDGQGNVISYFFDINKCKVCPNKEGCYKEGAKTKSYLVSVKTNTHKEYMGFQETEEFKDKAKDRYKIEAKNAELKSGHGYDVASSSGLFGMQLDAATTIFAVNLKRIIKLIEQKK